MLWRASILGLALVMCNTAFGHAEVSISLDSEPGDFVGGGKKQSLTPANGTFTVSRNFDNGVTINFTGATFWTFAFAAPFDGTLIAGVYENATRWPFQSPTAPGLSVFGGGGCNTLTGRFEVLYVVYGPSGDVVSFGANFEQHCEGAAPALFGQIRFNPALVAAVLPGSRSVQAAGGVASAFAAVINPGATTLTDCGIFPTTSVPGIFLFQATDSSTNQLVGTPNTRVGIPPGGLQTFYLAFTLGGILAPTDVHLYFVCSTDFAPTVVGVNTLLLSAAATQGPDIIALAATLGGDGIVDVPGTTGTGVFGVATVNVGTGGSIRVSANTGNAPLPVSLRLCQTNPATGVCLSPPASTVTTQIDANATPTFGIFVDGAGTVPFNPANNRVFVRFTDAGGLTRGATSVAVRTE